MPAGKRFRSLLFDPWTEFIDKDLYLSGARIAAFDHGFGKYYACHHWQC